MSTNALFLIVLDLELTPQFDNVLAMSQVYICKTHALPHTYPEGCHTVQQLEPLCWNQYLSAYRSADQGQRKQGG